VSFDERAQVVFNQWTCYLDKSTYSGPKRATALILTDVVDGDRVAVATVNLPEEWPPE
jgi:hypothetical protein